MKVLLNCLIKLENHYIEEWLTHYKNLHVDKIVIYDNNDSSGEYSEQLESIPLINQMKSSGFIDIVKVPDETCIQMRSYNECYAKYSNEYDWFIFLDIDEYLMLDKKYDNDIHNFLAEPMFKNYDMIHLNWKVYDDNDIIYVNNDYRVKDRFTRTLYESKHSHYYDKEVKSIVRGHLKDIMFTNNAHTIKNRILKCCNAIGGKTNSMDQRSNIVVHKNAWINHYICKTVEEYCTTKLKRLGGSTPHKQGLRYNERFFWMYNIRTSEKEKAYKKFMNENVISSSIQIPKRKIVPVIRVKPI